MLDLFQIFARTTDPAPSQRAHQPAFPHALRRGVSSCLPVGGRKNVLVLANIDGPEFFRFLLPGCQPVWSLAYLPGWRLDTTPPPGQSSGSRGRAPGLVASRKMRGVRGE